MSTALAVQHGAFGRAALYKLNRAFLTHAHREAHLTFHVRGEAARITVSDGSIALDDGYGEWRSIPGSRTASNLPGPCDVDGGAGALRPARMDCRAEGLTGSDGLRFGRAQIVMTAQVRDRVDRIVALLLERRRRRTASTSTWPISSAPVTSRAGTTARTESGWDRQLLYRDYRIRNSIRMMSDRIGDEMAIDGIARDAGLSRPHFYKLFRQHVGITPNIYMNTLRMESAIQRLTMSADPVTSIGLDLGFASQASFTRFFTTNVGVPPSDYRRAAHRLH